MLRHLLYPQYRQIRYCDVVPCVNWASWLYLVSWFDEFDVLMYWLDTGYRQPPDLCPSTSSQVRVIEIYLMHFTWRLNEFVNDKHNKYRKWRLEEIIRSFFLYFVPSLRRAARCLSRYLFCIWWGAWKLGAGSDNQEPTLSILCFRGRWRNAIMGGWESWAVIGQRVVTWPHGDLWLVRTVMREMGVKTYLTHLQHEEDVDIVDVRGIH